MITRRGFLVAVSGLAVARRRQPLRLSIDGRRWSDASLDARLQMKRIAAGIAEIERDYAKRSEVMRVFSEQILPNLRRMR